MYFLNKNLSWSRYEKILKNICSLSKLFSDNETPYLYYRAHENLFCRAFVADNLSRDDSSADAKKDGVGIGLKTFINNNGNSQQKIAEFNAKRDHYSNLEGKDLAKKISYLRNERISFTIRNYALKDLIYHCVTREKGKLKIFEEKMEKIDIDNIKIEKSTNKGVMFSDGRHYYNFNVSKSTLLKKFNTENYVEIPIEILEDPFGAIESIVEKNKNIKRNDDKIYWLDKKRIVLPLYSQKDKEVPEKSGLNQWNASGRKRDYNEIYIPIPAIVHKISPNFFPKRDKAFDLKLPNGHILSVKVCQNGSKALMSNPNKELGKWILRDVFMLNEGQILTRKQLDVIGMDAVEIVKIKTGEYSIDFRQTGMYEEFIETMSDNFYSIGEESE
ncbi:MAG: hypothetical protein ACRC6K_06055 [Fusobacteriaceae bacterium]